MYKSAAVPKKTGEGIKTPAPTAQQKADTTYRTHQKNLAAVPAKPIM